MGCPSQSSHNLPIHVYHASSDVFGSSSTAQLGGLFWTSIMKSRQSLVKPVEERTRQPSLRLEASTDQCQCAPQQGRPLIPSQHNLPGAHLGRLTQITQMAACSSRSVIDSRLDIIPAERLRVDNASLRAENQAIAFALCCESDRALNRTRRC